MAADLSNMSDDELLRLLQGAMTQQPQATPQQAASTPMPAVNSRQRMSATVQGYDPNAPRTDYTPPEPARTFADNARGYGDLAIGAAQMLPAATLGIPGDLESLARIPLSKIGVSPESAIPSSERIANSMFGEPKNPDVAAGRFIGGFGGPSLAVKGLKLATQGTKLATKGAGALTSNALGTTTGAGSRSVQEAYRAGRDGGIPGQVFLDNMRGNVPVDDVVQSARDAVTTLRQERSAQYTAGIGTTIKGDPTVLNFAPIDNAIRSTASTGLYKGKVIVGSAEKVWKKIEDVVDEWRTADPANFHTAEGLDALKQRIGNLAFDEDLKAVAGPGTPGSQIVQAVYNAVKKQIETQAPGYAKVMKDYSAATETLREIETGLSLGRKATVDTALRKLQSIMRNNANTNYGQRVRMGEMLDARTGGTLMPELAGQALNSPVPRGIQGPLAGGGGMLALATNPAALPLLALTSPRAIGEAAHFAGRLARGAKNATPQLPQLSGPWKTAAAALPHAARVSQEKRPSELDLLMLLNGSRPGARSR